MKFTRHLQDALTPEWKNAYIDYRALKAQLRAIRADSSLQTHTSGFPAYTFVNLSARNNVVKKAPTETCMDRESIVSPSLSETEPTMKCFSDSDTYGGNLLAPPGAGRHGILPVYEDLAGSPTPLHMILSNLPTVHVRFFEMLDAELAKVETFYSEREKEMHERAKLLRKQLHELEIHRQMFHESSARSKAQSWAKRAYLSVSSVISPSALFSKSRTKSKVLHRSYHIDRNSIMLPELKRGRRGFVGTSPLELENSWLSIDHSGTWKKDDAVKGAGGRDYSPEALDDFIRARLQRSNTFPGQSVGRSKQRFDPQEYQNAKKRLRKAVFEHYRGLEALNNYRALNLAGFRKALRKYGKITKNSILDVYMKERVEPSNFSSGTLLGTMLKEMEHLFAMRFERGDKKKAVGRLRVGSISRTYHLKTFRSGWWLGLALPAVVSGCYLSFQEYTRRTLPSWNILVFIYSVFLIPVLLAVLIGVNIVAWARSKINYVFIFGLDPRTRLDYHEYFELPSILLCTLSYAFWFSLAQIGPPMLWPLIWLILAFVVMFNPFRCLMWGRARWWANKKLAKLLASGIWEVEFTDVWLGDLMCSLSYSFSNLYFVGCFYTRFSFSSSSSTPDLSNHLESSVYASLSNNVTMSLQTGSSFSTGVFRSLLTSAYDSQAQTAWSTCGVVRNWQWYCLLGILPFLVRFVQCLRKYRDAKLSAQLLNAGKYGMGMVYVFFYYYWRYHMSSSQHYVLWCFMATLNAMYGYAWDLLMDWAMCRPGAQYPLLRPQLVYTSHIPCYYFAMLSNLCIRFIWLFYIFLDESNFERGLFIAGMLEMLRRVQWNFFRLENKHLNNMNLHRVTREVPLPYECVIDAHDEEARAHLQLRKRLAHLS